MRLMLDALRDFRTWQSSGGVGAWEEHAHGAGWKVVEDGSRVMDVIGEREREGGKQAAPDELILTLAPSAVLVVRVPSRLGLGIWSEGMGCEVCRAFFGIVLHVVGIKRGKHT